jgi:hypothetical protein
LLYKNAREASQGFHSLSRIIHEALPLEPTGSAFRGLRLKNKNLPVVMAHGLNG